MPETIREVVAAFDDATCLRIYSMIRKSGLALGRHFIDGLASWRERDAKIE